MRRGTRLQHNILCRKQGFIIRAPRSKLPIKFLFFNPQIPLRLPKNFPSKLQNRRRRTTRLTAAAPSTPSTSGALHRLS
jgi:hypothetical protein